MGSRNGMFSRRARSASKDGHRNEVFEVMVPVSGSLTGWVIIRNGRSSGFGKLVFKCPHLKDIIIILYASSKLYRYAYACTHCTKRIEETYLT